VNAPANTARLELTQRLVVDLGGAFHLRAAYGKDHPQVKGALARVLSALAAWFELPGTAEVSLILVEGNLLVDRQAIPDDAPWARGLIRAFRRHAIHGMTLSTGLDEAELGRFLDGCQGPGRATASHHIQIGQAGYAPSDDQEGGGAVAQPPVIAPGSIDPEQLEGVRAELRAVATGAVTRVDRLRSLIVQLVRGADAGSLDSLRRSAAHIDDREFLHGLSVALATLRLARALRVEGKALTDLTLAGFLHDVGYLEKATPDEGPAGKRHLHPVRGAARLAALEGIPDVALVVAYEHHLRFDGAPNHPAMKSPRRPIAEARVVAVADTWETLRSHGETGPEEALEILRARAGTFLDPTLVALFAEVVMKTSS